MANTECDLTVGVSPVLTASAFGVSIPGGSTINGVVVTFQRWQNSTGGVNTLTTNEVFLCNGSTCGTVLGSKTGAGTAWPGVGSASTETYGTSSDTWGATLTPAIINSSGFGFGLTVAAETNGGQWTPNVNSATIAITFTTVSNVKHTVFWPAKFVTIKTKSTPKAS
jgi:hypothetical protein